jgi:hypothetical protein
VLGDGRQLAQERLGDLAVGRDDDLARLAVDDVERDLLAEQDVGEASVRPSRSLSIWVLYSSWICLTWRRRSDGESFSCSLSMREETFTSMMMP